MIKYYFGAPGAGKTTVAVREVLQYYKCGLFTFTNFGCKCADEDNVNLAGIGEWTFPPNSYIAIDESGIEYNSRAWKKFSAAAIAWYKKHRHHLGESGVISLFSQDWEDSEKTIRLLAEKYYYLKKIGPFTLKRRMFKDIKPDEVSGEPRPFFKYVSMWYLILKPIYYISYLIPFLGNIFRMITPNFREIELIFRPFYYKYFDSYECEDLPCPFDVEELLEARKAKTTSNRIKGILRSCADRVRGVFKRG